MQLLKGQMKPDPLPHQSSPFYPHKQILIGALGAGWSQKWGMNRQKKRQYFT